MKKLQSIQELTPLKEAFDTVFLKTDPFGFPFQKKLNEKVLIYPTNGYFLSKKQFSSLLKTMEHFGQETLFLSESEGDSFNLSHDFDAEFAPQHWIIESTIDYKDYKSIPLALENSLYSSDGEWGIQISHEDHAILAGNSLFIHKFKEAYPVWKEDKEKFLQYWNEGNSYITADIMWVQDFVKQF